MPCKIRLPLCIRLHLNDSEAWGDVWHKLLGEDDADSTGTLFRILNLELHAIALIQVIKMDAVEACHVEEDIFRTFIRTNKTKPFLCLPLDSSCHTLWVRELSNLKESSIYQFP